MPDKQTTIDMMNMVRYFLPHLLSLSTSSPFWMGRNTGLKSFRTTVFRRFPRTGIPETFLSWSEYENFVNLLVRLNCIDNGKKIWWMCGRIRRLGRWNLECLTWRRKWKRRWRLQR